MNLAWKLRRLRAMGGTEVAFRVGRALQVVAEGTGLRLRRRRPPTPDFARSTRAQPWLSRDPGVTDVAPYVEAADRVLAGRIDFFSEKGLQIGFPPRWNLEPKSGIEMPLSFGKTLDYRNVERSGDVKYVWEINRHPQLVTLAQAWHLTRRRAYLDGCRELLDSWFAQCPCPYGINWTCSLEPAMRLANWSAAWHLLGGEQSPLFEGNAGRAFRQRWLDAVYEHCHFVAGYLSRHSSANNHLLGELFGLYIGASLWPLWPESDAWRAQAHAEFEREALRQNTPDGVNREQAVYYHHFVLEMMLFAGIIARAHGEPFAPAYWQRIEAMLDLLASVMDVGGHTPAIGDEDGAIVVNFSPGGIDDVYRSLLAKGAVLFGRADLRYKARAFNDQGRWLLGGEAAARFAALAPDSTGLPARKAFPQGGWYVLGDRFETADEVRLVVDVAPLGYLGIAAHGHADALACTLSVGGEEVLIDPGTYGYYIEKRWRDYFRSTAAHNTLRVDGVDQSVSGGPFLWTRHARAHCEQYASTGEQDLLTGTHDGYMRLTDPVLHHRHFCYEKPARRLVIRDALQCQGAHAIEQYWHIPLQRTLALDGHRLAVRTARHEILFDLPADCTVRVLQGSASPLAGWQSPRFGALEPCHTVIVSRATSGSWRGDTTLHIRDLTA